MPGEAAGSGSGAAIRQKYEAKLQAKRMKAMRRNEKLGLREGDVLTPDAWNVRPGAPQLLRCSPPRPLRPLPLIPAHVVRTLTGHPLARIARFPKLT
jgi:hypothetical protein